VLVAVMVVVVVAVAVMVVDLMKMSLRSQMIIKFSTSYVYIHRLKTIPKWPKMQSQMS